MVGWTEIGGREGQIAGAEKRAGLSSDEFYLYIYFTFLPAPSVTEFPEWMYQCVDFQHIVTRICVLVITQVI